MLSPVEMFLHWTELEPMKLITLLRNINLVQNILLAGSPEDALQHVQDGAIPPLDVGFIHPHPPPAFHQVGVQLQEQEQTIHVIDGFTNRGACSNMCYDKPNKPKMAYSCDAFTRD